MWRKRLVLIPAVVVAALVATTSVSAVNKPEVIRILEVPEGFTPLSASFDFAQLKAGDSFAFVQGLYTWAGTKRGKRIGHIDGSCQIVTAISKTGGGTSYCTASAFLPAGQLLFQGFQPFTAGPGTYVYPITGGTGGYSNARGWVDLKDIGSSGKTADVFHILT